MVWMAAVLAAALAVADEPPVHYLARRCNATGSDWKPATHAGGPLPGYFQPVEIMAPRAPMISLAAGGAFLPRPGPVGAGMLIGAVYRLQGDKHSRLRGTRSLSDHRSHRPALSAGRSGKSFSDSDRNHSEKSSNWLSSGRFVTRVIYLEDPQYPCAGCRSSPTNKLFRDSAG